jgi:hypothetical protein
LAAAALLVAVGGCSTVRAEPDSSLSAIAVELSGDWGRLKRTSIQVDSLAVPGSHIIRFDSRVFDEQVAKRQSSYTLRVSDPGVVREAALLLASSSWTISSKAPDDVDIGFRVVIESDAEELLRIYVAAHADQVVFGNIVFTPAPGDWFTRLWQVVHAPAVFGPLTDK